LHLVERNVAKFQYQPADSAETGRKTGGRKKAGELGIPRQPSYNAYIGKHRHSTVYRAFRQRVK
jgi:hypothetical protein